MSAREYRVVWQREGQARLQTRRYQGRAAAQRLLDLLTGDPHNGCDHDGSGYCYWETAGGDGTAPPFEIQPRIEERAVGDWQEFPAVAGVR